MRRSALPLLVLLAVGACRPVPPSRPAAAPDQTQPEPTSAEAFVDTFLDDYLARSPVTATLTGEHAHDDRWPDLSVAGRRATLTWIDERGAELGKYEGDPTLSEDVRVDLRIVRDQLSLTRLALEEERVWTTNPLAYAQLIGAGLDTLLTRDFAPLEARATSLAARLEALPELLTQATANLADTDRIKRPHAMVARSQMAGLESLITKEIPARTKDLPAPLRERIANASAKAVAALGQFHEDVLSDRALTGADGAWRLGADLFARKLPLTLGTSLASDEVYRRAVQTHEEVRGRMQALAQELRPHLLNTPPPKDPDVAVRDVLGALAQWHPEPADLRDAAEANLSRLESFVRTQKIVPMDEAEVLEVIWTPEHARGVAIAGLDPPGPLDGERPGLPSFYLVQPVPESWPAEVRASFLREYNGFMLEILSIHEAIPGHFVQLYYGKRPDAGSRLRRAFANGPFVEGWAVYTERVMVDHGYAGAAPPGPRPDGMTDKLWTLLQDDELRAKAIAIHGQKFFLRTVTNTILDHDIHAGTMTEAQAMALMTERSFQEEGEAKAKWTRAQVTSTQLSTYFVGASEWFDLRARAEKAGDAFDESAFHAEALSHGAPPVSALPALMGWD